MQAPTFETPCLLGHRFGRAISLTPQLLNMDTVVRALIFEADNGGIGAVINVTAALVCLQHA
eukprot:6071-Eustigmatos_ZCMA.PRE.1